MMNISLHFALESGMGEECLHVFWDDGMLKHRPTPGIFDTLDGGGGLLAVVEEHPENASRVKNIKSILDKGPISRFVKWHKGRQATVGELHLFHTPEYVRELVEAGKSGSRVLCPGTCFNPGSWEAILLAAGSTLEAMEHILKAKAKLAYALVRPPGHHAQPAQADGYCFANNAALAVEFALKSSSINRVAVVDIDVHFGNGTAEGFYRRDDVLTISLHMDHGSWGPSHPQSGQADQIGEGKGRGFNLNVPLPNGTGDRGYEYAMEQLVLPKLQSFKPEIIVVALGLDSSAFDPNGRQCLTMDGYRTLGKMIRKQADSYSAGRVLLVQEGGYQLCYTAYCAHAMLEGILGLVEPLLDDPIAYYPEDDAYAKQRVGEIKAALEQQRQSE